MYTMAQLRARLILRQLCFSHTFYSMTKRALKHFRSTYGLTQARLADALKVNVSTVAHWEQGVTPMPRWLPASLAALPLPVPRPTPPQPTRRTRPGKREQRAGREG